MFVIQLKKSKIIREVVKMEKIRVWVDHYDDGNSVQVVVFVNGHALVERDIDIANKLAKAAGQKTLPITKFVSGQMPIMKEYPVRLGV